MLAALSDTDRIGLLAPPTHPVAMVIDTDTYNEIDDQFALVYALLSPERATLEAIYAAPFHNQRSNSPADGMEQSFHEIERLLDRMGRSTQGLVFRGSEAWLPAAETPVESAAAHDLVARAMAPRTGPLYVVAIGAITNVASALLIEPAIASRIVVVWLGGHPTTWPHTREFNLMGDRIAARLIFDSGVALVHVPCINVAEHLLTSAPELALYVKGRGQIGDFLYDRFVEYQAGKFAFSKEIWDLAAVAWPILPSALASALTHSPILTDQATWSHDPQRHLIRTIIGLRRDDIFGDLFMKLAAYAERT